MAEVGRLITAMATPFDEAGQVDYSPKPSVSPTLS